MSLLRIGGRVLPLGSSINPGAALGRNATAYWDAYRQNDGVTTLTNYGTGGPALAAVFAATTNAPLWLTYSGSKYLYLPGIAGNSVTCTAPASATQFAAYPVGGGAPTTGAATGSALFTFSTVGSWLRVDLLNVGNVVVASFTVNAGSQTALTDAFGVVWAVNRATAGRKTVTVVKPLVLFGPDDYCEVADNPLLDIGPSDNLTVLACVRQWVTAVNGGRFASKLAAGSAGNPGYTLRSDSTTLTPRGDTIDASTAVGASASTPVVAGTLSTIGFTFTRTTTGLLMYVNGAAGGVGNVAALGTLANALPFRIGSRSDNVSVNPDFEFTAMVVDKRIWTPTQVLAWNTYMTGRP